MKVTVSQILFLLLWLPVAQCSKGQQNRMSWESPEPVSAERDTLINRPPAFAGSFYPGTRDALLHQLDRLFAEAVPGRKLDSVIAIVAPHAGYVYSGTVAASAYNQLPPGIKYDNIFIIGSSHHMNFGGAAVYGDGHYTTPLGTAKVNLTLVRKLIQDHPSLFLLSRDVHAPEHSIEVQVPFLQYLFGNDFQIVPIILGTQQPATCRKIAEALKPYLNPGNLFVISTDFSHYPGYADAIRTDALTAEAIIRNSPAAFLKILEPSGSQAVPGLVTRICGWTSMLTLLDITEKIEGVQYIPVQYRNSGDAAEGDKSRVVGYQAIAVTCNPKESLAMNTSNSNLTKKEKDRLLSLARNAIRGYLVSGEIPPADSRNMSANLLSHSGAFVTLKKEGKLRGCTGQFTTDIPLYQVVQEMAISAATRDNRFDPLTYPELAQTHIEISVLTPMRRVASPEEIILGRHGIYIRKGDRAGTFLPQVAAETGWTLQEFLGHCARDKAGIGWDGWKDADIYVYEAYVFGE